MGDSEKHSQGRRKCGRGKVNLDCHLSDRALISSICAEIPKNLGVQCWLLCVKAHRSGLPITRTTFEGNPVMMLIKCSIDSWEDLLTAPFPAGEAS